MIGMQLSAAATALEARLLGTDAPFEGVSTDTRTLARGQLFFALRGPHHDAHDMLDVALAQGAAGAVVQRPGPTALPTLVVEDPRRSLGHLARAWRARFAIPVLAVTGSAGKTTVKEMLAAIMAVRGPTLATRGNLNNDIGVPLTLFRLGPEHDVAVIEMGANRPGDIALLCDIAQPCVGVITLCAPAHLEGFGDIDTVARTKGEIVATLPADGIAVINNEDAFAPLWRELAGARRTITFGDGGMVSAHDVAAHETGTAFRLQIDGAHADVVIAHQGLHNVRNALAAAAAATAAGASVADIVAGLAAAAPAKGRLQRRMGDAGLRLIDDSYNANPASLQAALDVLAAEPGRRWLVLGDMGELGERARDFHELAGRQARAAGVERLFALGPLSVHAVEAFGAGAEHCSDHEALIGSVRGALHSSTTPITLLIKGSRMMALERIVDGLRAVDAEDVRC